MFMRLTSYHLIYKLDQWFLRKVGKLSTMVLNTPDEPLQVWLNMTDPQECYTSED